MTVEIPREQRAVLEKLKPIIGGRFYLVVASP